MGSQSRIRSVQTLIFSPFLGAQESLSLIRGEAFFRRCHIEEPRREGMGPSKQRDLEELKYLARSVAFHQFVLPVIKRQEIFSPNEVFNSVGSLMVSHPLLRGWKTCF